MLFLRWSPLAENLVPFTDETLTCHSRMLPVPFTLGMPILAHKGRPTWYYIHVARARGPRKGGHKARIGVTMTNQKNAVTRAAAMDYALRVIRAYEPNADVEDVIAKLAIQFAKKPAKNGPTKAQRDNLALIAECEDAMRAHVEPVTARWIAENVHGVMTVQKAAALARVAGWTKVYEGKTTYYTLGWG